MNEIKKPYRGTIILDACTLFDLNCAVEPQFRDPLKPNGIRHYLDIIPMLANNGFKIVIPEIVMYEVSALLRNGKCVDDYFPKRDEERSHVKFPEIQKFLKAVMADRDRKNPVYPNIEIAPVSEPEVKKFLDDLVNITNSYREPCAQSTAALVKIQQSASGRHYGDLDIESLLNRYADEINNGKVYLFSDDKGLLSRQGQQWPQLNLLDRTGFINALCAYKPLANHLGIKSNFTPATMVASISSQLAHITNKSKTIPRGFTDSYMDGKSVIDFETQKCRFLEAMEDLAADLEKIDQEQNIPQAPLPNKPLTAVERFNARWQGRPPSNNRGLAG